MTRDIKASILGALVITLLFGLVYPLVITGISQLAFHNQANGSVLRYHGKIVGSRLIAQAFDRPVLGASGKPTKDKDGNEVREADPAWFQPRPSQTNYSGNASTFLNQGPNQKDLADLFAVRQKAYMKLEGRYNPHLSAATVPVDAVANSASGIDPHISLDNAYIQSARVARERGTGVDKIRSLIKHHVDGRFLGLFGEPGVNVLELNLALDKEYPTR